MYDIYQGSTYEKQCMDNLKEPWGRTSSSELEVQGQSASCMGSGELSPPEAEAFFDFIG